MYRSIAEIHQAFDKKGLKHAVNQVQDKWIIETVMGGDASKYKFLFIKTDDEDNDVAVRVFSIANVPNAKRMQALRLLNKLQLQYRYVRLNLDDDGDINMEYDFPVEFSPIGEGAVEMLMRCVLILDKIYPELMRLIWS